MALFGISQLKTLTPIFRAQWENPVLHITRNLIFLLIDLRFSVIFRRYRNKTLVEIKSSKISMIKDPLRYL